MTSLNKIDHIVVLMLENRSFDNMLGKLYPASAAFNGLTGNETNADPNGNPLKVWNNSPDTSLPAAANPDHVAASAAFVREKLGDFFQGLNQP